MAGLPGAVDSATAVEICAICLHSPRRPVELVCSHSFWCGPLTVTPPPPLPQTRLHTHTHPAAGHQGSILRALCSRTLAFVHVTARPTQLPSAPIHSFAYMYCAQLRLPGRFLGEGTRALPGMQAAARAGARRQRVPLFAPSRPLPDALRQPLAGTSRTPSRCAPASTSSGAATATGGRVTLLGPRAKSRTSRSLGRRRPWSG